LLLHLWNRQQAAWEGRTEKLAACARTVYEKVQALPVGYQLTRDALDKLLTGQDCMPSKSFIFLPPLQDNMDCVPVLYLPESTRTWEMSSKADCVKYCVALFRDSGRGKAAVKSIVYRFETAHRREEGGDEGKHSYCHCQASHGPERNISVAGCPDWLPDEVPCFPLRANDPVSLLLCLVISLYGRGSVKRMFGSIGRLDKHYLQPIRDIA